MYQRHITISAIVTCYFEENTIDQFYGRLSKALASSGLEYEIILVNDGSTDKTFEKLRSIFEQDQNVTSVVDFIKNSGQLAAMTAGITRSTGNTILFIDSDLQLDPEDLPILLARYEEGFDVVSGKRRERKDSVFRIIPSAIANWVMRRVSKSNLTDFGCTFKLYNALIIRAFELGPMRLFNTASVIAQAQTCCEVPINHHERPHGKSGWTFRKLWQFNMDNIVNMSEKPFQIVATACFIAAALLVLRVIFALANVPFKVLDTVSNGLILNAIVVSLLFLLSVISVLGEFCIRTFLSLQHHPKYIVREVITRVSPLTPTHQGKQCEN